MVSAIYPFTLHTSGVIEQRDKTLSFPEPLWEGSVVLISLLTEPAYSPPYSLMFLLSADTVTLPPSGGMVRFGHCWSGMLVQQVSPLSGRARGPRRRTKRAVFPTRRGGCIPRLSQFWQIEGRHSLPQRPLGNRNIMVKNTVFLLRNHLCFQPW